MFLLVMLLCIASSRAGLVVSDLPITTTLTNVHSPSAISHQSITQIHANEKQVATLPYIYQKEAHRQETLVLPSTHTTYEPLGHLENINLHNQDASLKSSSLILTKTPLHTYHQEITQPETAVLSHTHTFVENNNHEALLKPSTLVVSNEPLKIYHKESNSLGTNHATDASAEYENTSKHETSSANSNEAPVFTSHTHTPAHLTFAASPIVYKMLPQINSKPYKSYEHYLTSHSYK